MSDQSISDASKFLKSWVRENIKATDYDDTASARYFAERCLFEAQGEQLSEVEVIKAAGGDLAAFLLAEFNRAFYREVGDRGRAR
jgi:hypothetical protein